MKGPAGPPRTPDPKDVTQNLRNAKRATLVVLRSSVASKAGLVQACPSMGTTSVCPESITPGRSADLKITVDDPTDGSLIFRTGGSGGAPGAGDGGETRKWQPQQEGNKKQRTENAASNASTSYAPGSCPNCGGKHDLKICRVKWQPWLKEAAKQVQG